MLESKPLSKALWVSWATWGIGTALGIVRFHAGQNHAQSIFGIGACAEVIAFLLSLRPLMQAQRAIESAPDAGWRAASVERPLTKYLLTLSGALAGWLMFI